MANTVPLLTAGHFEILAGSGITFAGAVNSSKITGDIGTYPTNSVTGIGNAVLTGTNFSANGPVMVQAKADLVAAYLNAAGQGPAVTVPTELGGTSPVPGVYKTAAGTLQITTVLTLDAKGNSNAVWIFQAASTLITSPGSSVVLLNGAQACNVFWQVGSSATVDTTTAMAGIILALTSITINTGATLNGAALARNGAVTLDTNTCVNCTLSTPGGPELLMTHSCLSCLSDSQLTKMLLFVLAAHHLSGYSLPGGLNKLFADSACYGCLGDRQLKQVAIASLINLTLPGQNVKQIEQSMACLNCSNPQQVKAALAYLVTKIGLPA